MGLLTSRAATVVEKPKSKDRNDLELDLAKELDLTVDQTLELIATEEQKNNERRKNQSRRLRWFSLG